MSPRCRLRLRILSQPVKGTCQTRDNARILNMEPVVSAAPTPPVIAILGTGRMGLPMATRLCQAGLTVHAWNRNRSKADWPGSGGTSERMAATAMTCP